MLTTTSLTVGLMVTALSAATWHLYGRNLISPSAWERRRRARSYRRVANRRTGPAIQLNARTSRY